MIALPGPPDAAPAAAAPALEAAWTSTVLLWSLDAVVAILGIAILLVVFRLLRGPTLPDRVVALDMVGTLAAGAIAVIAVREGQPVYLYVAIVLALVLFVGTVAFGYYLEKGMRHRGGLNTGMALEADLSAPRDPDGKDPGRSAT